MDKVISRKYLFLWIKNHPLLNGTRSTYNKFSNEHESKVKKKVLSSETMAPTYNPESVESGWYDWWESKGYFKPKQEGKIFTMLLPPPNVTGTLHLGHAFTVTIQDVLIRWMRMNGENVLWVPGFDHAGIATQLVVEKYLKSVSNVTKHELGREEFLMKISEWKAEKENTIIEQLKQLGASVDWDRKYFTMDRTTSDVVQNAFIHLYNKGLIELRDELINWSCFLRSSLSDMEVERRLIKKPCNISIPGYTKSINFGYIYKFSYKVWNDDGKEGEELIISTTRPETILGDTAVAVHPDDSRYSHLKDKFVWHPFRMCKIPVIFDELVDPHFGTGALKITPAHCIEDSEIAKRHNIESLDVIDEDGLIKTVGNCGQFQGMKRFDAKRKILDELQNLGVYKGKEEHSMTIPICSRSGDIVEYIKKPQWFLKCSTLYEKLRTAILNGTVKIEPEVCQENLLDWISRGRDWNLSRQIWLGHRIPLYDCKSKSERFLIPAASGDEARSLAAEKFKSKSGEIEITQVPDVLDTWFSSALLPLSVSGWPQKISPCYPFGLMETGRDIIFLWVARMLMLGLELVGEVPFNHVVLHGLVCDNYGRKMSKTLGNVILPENVIKGISQAGMKAQSERNCQLGLISPNELKLNIQGQEKMFPTGIPECGADALRMTLCNNLIKGEKLNFSVHVCQANRFFCNKMWQALTFFLKNIENKADLSARISDKNFSIFDTWILSSLAEAVELVNAGIGDLKYHVSVQAIRRFFIKQFCDIYIESCKPVFLEDSNEDCKRVASVMFNCFETSFLLCSPFMPFVTEELYHHLPQMQDFVPSESIIVAAFPDSNSWSKYKNPKVDVLMAKFMNILSCIRSARSIYKLSKQKLKVILDCSADSDVLFSDEIRRFLIRQASVHEFVRSEGIITERNVIKLTDDDFTAYLYHEHSKDALQSMFGAALSKENELKEHLERLKLIVAQTDYQKETTAAKQKNLLTLTHLEEELRKIKEVREVIDKAE